MVELDISSKHCRVEKDGHTLIVTLSRPEAKNAFSSLMLLDGLFWHPKTLKKACVHLHKKEKQYLKANRLI